MNKIEEENYTTRWWNTKHISEPDESWYILKFFKTKKQMLPIDEQRILLNKKMQYLGAYIPETHLVEIKNWEYVIKQQFIKWKTLAETNISDLSANTLSKLLDLIKKYIQYHKEQWWDMDIMGFQIYKWNPCHFERMIRNFLKINKNFLVSTNIMISNDGNVYMVDVCESADRRLPWKIKNFCAKPFIKRTISNLEKTLQKKINLENENIKKDILDAIK